jgi:hypothetical protein
MARPFTPVRYHHTEQLRFKHLGRHELFMFPGGHGTPAMGPYMKLSARRYVPVRLERRGLQYIPHIAAVPVHQVGSINAAVTDRISDYDH